MTHISIVFRKVGSLIISKTTDEDPTTVVFYQFKYRCNEAHRLITELVDYVDSYDTHITVVNFPFKTKVPYYNEILGSLNTLKILGVISNLTFITDPMKMYKRIHSYLNASVKKRNKTTNGISKLLLDSDSCKFYTNAVDIMASNHTNQVYNSHKMSIITLYYSIIKERLINASNKNVKNEN